MHIFIDESGDLGFSFNKRNTSKYFIVTLLMTDSKRPIEKLVKDIHKSLRKKYKIRNSLHAAHEEDVTKIRFCRKLSLKACKVATIYLDKKRYKEKVLNKHEIYIKMVAELLANILESQGQRTVTITVSQRETNRNLNAILVNHILNDSKSKIKVEIRTPDQEKCLQAVDIISWSFFRKYENDDLTYSRLFAPIIRGEYSYIP